jgi:RNA polymerase sigma factor (TIGR02999 family)
MEPTVDPANIATLMAGFRRGDRASAGKLVELLYPQLRRLAGGYMRGERAWHTWQPTALVNQLYLELVKVRALGEHEGDGESEKAAFLALSAQIMRRLLIHHARPLARRAAKEELPELPELRDPQAGSAALVEVEDALDRLGEIDPRLRTVVELRVFEELTVEETAQSMGCGHATVSRYWRFAREWLAREFATETPA